MIEEEDDEEILKKGITLKSALKNLIFIFMIILGAIFIYGGIIPDQVSSWTIGFMLICIGATLMQMKKTPAEPIKQTLTILICNLCGLTKVRNYEKGDFVFKKVSKCDKCHELMEIKQVYSVKLKKPTESNKITEEKKKKKESIEKLN
ncbi:hypothetical protein LCGC14_1172510 [marine sediment metagenome]|uniref:Uncharacterized protein n=1 Tax=marine sediment metagenome TaxID=412755 RepID=A0A0F9PUY4_9ZZZZ